MMAHLSTPPPVGKSTGIVLGALFTILLIGSVDLVADTPMDTKPGSFAEPAVPLTDVATTLSHPSPDALSAQAVAENERGAPYPPEVRADQPLDSGPQILGGETVGAIPSDAPDTPTCTVSDTGLLRDCADWYTVRTVLEDGSILRDTCKLQREYTQTNSISLLWGLITIGYGESEEWCDYGDCGEMSAVDSQLR